MDGGRLDWHLWNWANWQRRSRFAALRSLWYPGRAGSGIGRSHASDFDGMVSAADVRCARAVEGALAGCSPAERAAVHHKHLEAVDRARGDLEALYASALRKISDHLTRAGIV